MNRHTVAAPIFVVVCCLTFVSPAHSVLVKTPVRPLGRIQPAADPTTARTATAGTIARKIVPTQTIDPSVAKQSPRAWNVEVGTSLRRGLDAQAHEVSLLGLKISRQWRRSAATLDLAYFNQWAPFSDPRMRGFEDTYLSWRHDFNNVAPPHWETRLGERAAPYVVGHLALGLPTSATSLRATQYLTLRSALQIIWLMRQFTLRHEHGGQFFAHKYDTADLAGQRHNPQVALFQSLTLEVPLTERVRLTFSGEFFSYWTYRQKQQDLLSARARLASPIRGPLIVFAELVARNQRVSNLSLFDDDNTQFAVGALYAL